MGVLRIFSCYFGVFSTCRNFILVFPQKMGLSILNTLIILRALDMGFDPLKISVITFLNVYSMFLVSTYLPRLSNLSKLFGVLPHISYIFIFLSILLLTIDNTYLIFLSSFNIFLFSYIVYYLLYFSIKDNGYKDKSIHLSKLEFIGGFAWVLGLLLGFILSFWFSIIEMIYLVSFIPILGLLISLIHFKLDKKEFKRVNLIPIFPRIFVTVFRSLFNYSFSLSKLVNGHFNESGWKRFSLKNIFLLIFFFNFSISLFYTHLIPYEHSLGFSSTEIFLLVLSSSFMSMSTYVVAGKLFNGNRSIVKAIVFRIFVYLSLLAAILFSSGLDLRYNFFIQNTIFIMIGLSWSFLSISISSMILSLRSKDISTTNLIGGLGNIGGILMAGLFFSTFGYHFILIFSLLTMVIALIFAFRKPLYIHNLIGRRLIENVIILEHHRLSIYRILKNRHIVNNTL